MKLNIQLMSYSRWLMAIVFFAGLAACSKDDVSQPFVDGGEFIYPAKADSIMTRGGKGRLELSWLLLADPKITKYKVYWNNRKDSIEKEVQRTENVDTVRLMFNNMAEGTYNFEIYTFDKHNNRSVKATAVGKVYGDLYQKNLFARVYKTVSKFEGYYQINWNEPDVEFASANVEFLDENMVLQKVRVGSKDVGTKLINIKPWGGAFTYVTKYVPEPKALDTFSAPIKSVTLPEFSWDNYNQIFGHFGDLLVQDKNFDLFRLSKKPDGTFGKDIKLLTGWNASTPSSLGNDLFSLSTAVNGSFIRTPLTKGGNVGTQTQISTGWQVYDKIVTTSNGFILRYGPGADVGKLNFYTFDPATGKFPVQRVKYAGTTLYNIYDAMVFVSSGAIIARKPTGELYWMSVNATGDLSAPVLIDQGWNQFTFVSSIDDSVIARSKTGQLWLYPMNGKVLGPRKELVNDIN